MSLSQSILYYGRDETLPKQIPLRAGPLSLLYEAGDLRYIRLGEYEILRRVYVAVRDQNWGTITPVLSNIRLESGPDTFHLIYDVVNRQGAIDFFWQGEISGDAQGAIIFAMRGQARSTFWRNRIGFCILHPMACAGAPCRIEHVDGSLTEAAFPQSIAPQLLVDGRPGPVQPFAEMRAMAHQVRPGLWTEVRYHGDIFELEDQRNWTDASYKTYSTPLRLPFPVEVPAGTEIVQSVTLTLTGEPPARSAAETATPVMVTVNPAPAGPFPRLGLGVAGHGHPLTPTELDRLKALNLAHLRVDLRLSDPTYERRLRQATAEAQALGVRLEIALFLSDAAVEELTALLSALPVLKPPVWAWLIFHQAEKSTADKWVRLARRYLIDYDPTAKIAAGTNIYFTELNRGRPALEALDLVTYSLNPQVHAFDNASLVEALAAQAVTVHSARQFCGDRPLIISPITLKPRFNPNAAGPEPAPAPGELPAPVDARQMSLLGAGWTAGSLKYLAESAVFSLTYYETTGWRGVMETETGSPMPAQFPSLPGAVFPLYHVLADVGEFAGGDVLPTQSGQPLAVDGLALRRDGRLRLMLANLSPQPQQVTIPGLPTQVQVRLLDERNALAAMQSPAEFRALPGQRQATAAGTLHLTLLPYAIARIDSR